MSAHHNWLKWAIASFFPSSLALKEENGVLYSEIFTYSKIEYKFKNVCHGIYLYFYLTELMLIVFLDTLKIHEMRDTSDGVERGSFHL